MTGKFLLRSIRRRRDAAIVWAMMPVALLSGRSVSGCLSPTGRFEPDCHCAAMLETAVSTSPAHEASTCHRACCHGKCCCCKGMAGCSEGVAAKESPSKHDGFQNGAHCRPVSLFVAVTVTNAGGQSWDLHQLATTLPVAQSDWLPTVQDASVGAFELDTGPPPENLVVDLHRWLI